MEFDLTQIDTKLTEFNSKAEKINYLTKIIASHKIAVTEFEFFDLPNLNRLKSITANDYEKYKHQFDIDKPIYFEESQYENIAKRVGFENIKLLIERINLESRISYLLIKIKLFQTKKEEIENTIETIKENLHLNRIKKYGISNFDYDKFCIDLSHELIFIHNDTNELLTTEELTDLILLLQTSITLKYNQLNEIEKKLFLQKLINQFSFNYEGLKMHFFKQIDPSKIKSEFNYYNSLDDFELTKSELDLIEKKYSLYYQFDEINKSLLDFVKIYTTNSTHTNPTKEIETGNTNQHTHIFKNNAFEVWQAMFNEFDIKESSRSDIKFMYEEMKKDGLIFNTVNQENILDWINETYQMKIEKTSNHSRTKTRLSAYDRAKSKYNK